VTRRRHRGTARVRIGVQIDVNVASAHLVNQRRERLVRERATRVGGSNELLANAPVLHTGQREQV
jgi:hypothetical protein